MRRGSIGVKKEQLQAREDNLLGIFEEIHDYIYSNDGLSPQQTLDEFIKILFIKIYDESRGLNEFHVRDIEANDAAAGIQRAEMFNEILGLFEQTKEEFAGLFDPDDRIRLSHHSLKYAAERLQGISLLGSSRDAKGLAFQKFLTHHEKNSRGQFFTPEPVIDFCVKIISPRPGEMILDPACGSGGFLVSSLNYMIKAYSDADPAGIIDGLHGVEINRSIARISKMKLLLEMNVNSNIICGNSLDPGRNGEKYDIILTNPPFGGKINQPQLLSEFELGRKWSAAETGFSLTGQVLNKQSVEILFIERCLDMLKAGGRMAIVLPNGCFENQSLDYLRYYIQKRARLLAVISLPDETFIPYGTGVKTSLLFLEKHKGPADNEYQIFFGRITKPGYLGNKNGTIVYKKGHNGETIKDEGGEPLIDEDISDILVAWSRFKHDLEFRTRNSFSIRSTDLRGRFDFDFYSPENREFINIISSKKTVKLGDVCKIVKSRSEKLKMPDLTVRYVELSDINFHTHEIIDSESMPVHRLPERACFEIFDGDIITAVAGNSVGTKKHATALVTPGYSGCICTNGLRVLREFKIDPFYLLFYMKTEKYLKQIYMYRTGAAIPKVSDAFLSEIIIELPEQRKIDEISTMFSRAFALRSEANSEIEKLMRDDLNFGKS